MKHDSAAPPPAPVAAAVFGDRLELAIRYAELLATDGVDRGLLGPREADRLWDRHLLNSALAGEAIATQSSVADIGSGAGLPGIPLAIVRPDLRITLIEPLLRRSTFLSEAVQKLGLDNVVVVRGRAEDSDIRRSFGNQDVVTSRAVAPLDKLARWSLPLVRKGGAMVALKGDRAEAELVEFQKVLGSLGVTSSEVMKCGVGIVDQPTTVVIARTGGSGKRG